jgi:trk system potassium uptake protein TrkA
MHIIIVGCGRVGSALAAAGANGGDDVVVIDTDPQAFRSLGVGFNGVTMRGTGCDQEQLRQAGIQRCDAFVAATDSDSVNMMAAEIALRIYHVPRVVVRLYEPEHERSMQVLGLSYVNDAALSVQAILDALGSTRADDRQESA